MLATTGERLVDYSDFLEVRLVRRMKMIIDSFIQQPQASIAQACESNEASKGAYRFFDNEQVTHGGLIKAEANATWAMVRKDKPKRVIVAQDTSDLDYSHHPATEGMGPLENEHMQGLLVHSALAVSEHGLPLGLVGQQVWVRSAETIGKRHKRKERLIEDKESMKWLNGLPDVPEAVKADGTKVVMVSDRESDVYEVLQACSQRPDLEAVIRASWNRALTDGKNQHLFEAIRAQPILHNYPIHIQATATRIERDALLSVRFTTVTLRPPKRPKDSPELSALSIGVVEVFEAQPPAGQSPIHWLLLTTLPLNTIDDALTVIRYYTYRWLIERFHFVLKSGCRIEQRQLQTVVRLERLLAIFSVVAWSLLWLTHLARLTPDAPASLALSDSQWRALAAYKNRTTKPLAEPTLHLAVRWIAQLGGFLGRRADGEPGVKTLWQGWQRLYDITQTWILFNPSPNTYG